MAHARGGASRALRVAFVTERASPTGGWGRYAYELVRASRDTGVEPVLVSHVPADDPSFTSIEQHTILPPALGGRFPTLRSLAARQALARVLSSCDIVHNIVEPYLPLVAWSLGPNQPLVQTAHGMWAVRPFAAPLRRLLFRPAFRRVSLLVAQSRFTRDALRRLVDLPKDIVVPAAVRSDAFAGDVLPAVVPPDDTAPLLLMAGPPRHRRGTHVALDALAHLEVAGAAPHLAVLGSRPDDASEYAVRLRAQAEARGLAGRLHWVDAADEVSREAWYRRADLFLFPAVSDALRFEGLGVACIEAAACGVPVIASRECGAEDAVIHDVTGLLVAQDDAGALAHAVERLLADPATRDRMSRAAVAFARHVSWERLAGRLKGEYASLLQAAARRQGRWSVQG